jgi:hypothetical protein
MMAVGATLLCASCMRSAVVEYGPAIIPDAARPTVDAGAQPDGAFDALPDANK